MNSNVVVFIRNFIQPVIDLIMKMEAKEKAKGWEWYERTLGGTAIGGAGGLGLGAAGAYMLGWSWEGILASSAIGAAGGAAAGYAGLIRFLSYIIRYVTNGIGSMLERINNAFKAITSNLLVINTFLRFLLRVKSHACYHLGPLLRNHNLARIYMEKSGNSITWDAFKSVAKVGIEESNLYIVRTMLGEIAGETFKNGTLLFGALVDGTQAKNNKKGSGQNGNIDNLFEYLSEKVGLSAELTANMVVQESAETSTNARDGNVCYNLITFFLRNNASFALSWCSFFGFKRFHS